MLNKPFILFSILFIIVMATALFHVKYQVRYMKRDLQETSLEIEAEQQRIQVLKAEWSYLNRADRLEKLAQTYLTLVSPTSQQVATLDQLYQQQAKTTRMLSSAPKDEITPVIPERKPMLQPQPVSLR